MHKYFYDGPVLMFGTCIHRKWVAETTAPSEAKARSNLEFRFKKEYDKAATAKITLPGKLKIVN